jgi:serine/threonine-protein kinase RsbW
MNGQHVSESWAPGPYRSRLKECYPAVPSSVPAAREAIVEFAASLGAIEQQLDAVRLAASEALTNVVQHAYRTRLGPIHVTAKFAGGELWVLIADSGCGLHTGHKGDGLGLGLALITEMTDGFSIVECPSGGTEMRMRFDVAQERRAR